VFPVTYPGSRIGTRCLADPMLNEIRIGQYFQLEARTQPRTGKVGRISVGTRFEADQMPSLTLLLQQALADYLINKGLVSRREESISEEVCENIISSSF
jgi:hypothetical protein